MKNINVENFRYLKEIGFSDGNDSERGWIGSFSRVTLRFLSRVGVYSLKQEPRGRTRPKKAECSRKRAVVPT